MTKHTKRSVIPIYLIGVVWLVYALLFPLRTATHFLICGALSLVAFVAGKGLFPDKVYEIPGGKKTEAPKAEKKVEKKASRSAARPTVTRTPKAAEKSAAPKASARTTRQSSAPKSKAASSSQALSVRRQRR